MSNHASTLRQPLAPAETDALLRELAGLIIQALNLELSPTGIDPDAPLYGEGLGLDSIDILEIALVVSKRYGVQLRADSAENEQIFGSLRRLAEYINAHRTT
jgi:acyl carrier protein